jgi:hypothetical protein
LNQILHPGILQINPEVRPAGSTREQGKKMEGENDGPETALEKAGREAGLTRLPGQGVI